MRITLWEPQGALTVQLVVDVLDLVDIAQPRTDPAQWTELELALAYDYAMRVHYHASDNIVRLRPRPSYV